LYRIAELVSAMTESDVAFVGMNSLLLLELLGVTELFDVVVSPGRTSAVHSSSRPSR
jgi:hypothetical protein